MKTGGGGGGGGTVCIVQCFRGRTCDTIRDSKGLIFRTGIVEISGLVAVLLKFLSMTFASVKGAGAGRKAGAGAEAGRKAGAGAEAGRKAGAGAEAGIKAGAGVGLLILKT